MVGTIVLSPTDAASQDPVMSSAQRVVVARARAPRDAAVQHCLEYLGYSSTTINICYAVNKDKLCASETISFCARLCWRFGFG